MLVIYRIQYLISVSVQTRQIESGFNYHSIFHWRNYILIEVVILALMAVVISSVNHNTLPKWKGLCNFLNEWKNNFAGSVKVAIIVIRLIVVYAKNLNCST